MGVDSFKQTEYMTDTIFMWNIWGLGRFRRRLKKLINKYNAIVVAISKPFVGKNMIQQLTTFSKFPNYCCNEHMGGKIWLFWHAEVGFDIIFASNQLITSWCTLNNTQTFVLIIYAKCSQVEYRNLWTQLCNQIIEIISGLLWENLM